ATVLTALPMVFIVAVLMVANAKGLRAAVIEQASADSDTGTSGGDGLATVEFEETNEGSADDGGVSASPGA
ncbi:MAG: hypothetical protein J5804_01375, partial [Eggerthellaceae bacterium]|nr:hypothetical protein [Eggerthellaceae bacterium]